MVPSLPCCPASCQCPWKKTLIEKKGFNFSFKMQFLSLSGSKNPKFIPAGSFFLVQQMKLKCLPEYPHKFLVTRMYYNGLSTGYSRKKSIHKFFDTALKKNHKHTESNDLQFHIFQFSQNGFLDFHVTTATADVCMKEVIDSSLWRAF